MTERARPGAGTPQSAAGTFTVQPPSISLPKGGGAIRGIGEKFTANPVLGTGAVTVPLVTPPGRGGFGPTLELGYDSGRGNGPFGFGWALALPSITRKTDKGLPRYIDDDVFVLSAAEDLVPELDAAGSLIESVRDGYRVRRYRPRVEGLFARIERWSKPGDTHWRSISRDNTTTIYGRTENSRIADPADRERIFSWLVCESYDGKGNVVRYSYAVEDASAIDGGLPHERNRAGVQIGRARERDAVAGGVRLGAHRRGTLGRAAAHVGANGGDVVVAEQLLDTVEVGQRSRCTRGALRCGGLDRLRRTARRARRDAALHGLDERTLADRAVGRGDAGRGA